MSRVRGNLSTYLLGAAFFVVVSFGAILLLRQRGSHAGSPQVPTEEPERVPYAEPSAQLPDAAPVEMKPDRRRVTSGDTSAFEVTEVSTAEDAKQVLASVFGDTSIGPEDQRSEFLSALRLTGPSQEPWTAEVKDLLGKRSRQQGVEPTLDCFRAGCYAEYESGDAAALEAAVNGDGAALPSDSVPASWRGGTIITPVEEASDGRFVRSVVFVRP